jgi:uncharacterized coiled-coil DUF342 family protein
MTVTVADRTRAYELRALARQDHDDLHAEAAIAATLAEARAEAEAEAERRLDALIDVRAKRDALIAALAAARAEADKLRADVLALVGSLEGEADEEDGGTDRHYVLLYAAARLRALAGDQP